jgi:putative ABC transport system permease protein
MRIPLAWLQLTREKRRLVAALAGVAFAVTLMLMQLGFRDAAFNSVTLFHTNFRGQLVLTSRQYEIMIFSSSFLKSRLYQALGVEGVESVAPVYLGLANWKNPQTGTERSIFVVGFKPSASALAAPGIDEGLKRIELPDVVLLDTKSRAEFGAVADRLSKGGIVTTEINGRKIQVGGLYTLGSSFASNGNVVTSDLNFLRIFNGRKPESINLGLINLRAGADPERMRERLVAALPQDVKVLTHQAFVDQERATYADNLPLGFIFNLGMVMGMIVGAVIVYQILYTDVNDHLAEYATLKAMGHGDRYLFSIVLQEALILSFFGFLVGLAIAQGIYSFAQSITNLPIYMTVGRVALIFGLTVFMCAASGALAMRKLKSADPAEVF